MTRTYKKSVQIRFREADPARILYFANLFSLAHDCFEDFIQEAGFSWAEWFHEPASIVPIRHAECDYRAPFIPGQHYEIFASVAGFRETSLQMQYVFKQNDRIHAVVKMVHAFLDPATKRKKNIPDNVKSRLQPYLAPAEETAP